MAQRELVSIAHTLAPRIVHKGGCGRRPEGAGEWGVARATLLALSSADMPTLHRLIGVYHANGSLVGELLYVFGKLTGHAHCALCDITHAGVREKAEFRACRTRHAVPIETVHLDERDEAVAAFTEGKTPCVVAATSEGLVLLLDAATLDRCGARVARFESELDAALVARGLSRV